MQYDIRNMNIWRQDQKVADRDKRGSELRDIKLEELNLSVRSFNSLKRAECNTVGDILDAMDEEGEGLRKFRNLGVLSEKEIKEKLEVLFKEHRCASYHQSAGEAGRETAGQYDKNNAMGGSDSNMQPGIRIVLRPARNLWAREIGEFHLSNYAESRLRSSGVNKVGDLYATHPKSEPGWYAVRELFRKIAEYSE